MSNTLAAKAAAAAGRTTAGDDRWPDDEPATAPADDDAVSHDPAELPDVEYTDPIEDPAEVPVQIAWSRVMRDVKSIGKGRLYNANGTRYNYRGVDEVFNAIGPALRRHGVVILPASVEPAYRDTKTSKGTVMRECTVAVTYTIIGPAGDTLTASSQGEALDTMDKSTSKALSLAYRNVLLQALCVPTNLPDPEAATGIERGELPVPRATDFRDQALDPSTSFARLGAIRGEVLRHGLAGEVVTNEVGDDERLGDLIARRGREIQAARGQA